MLGKHFTVELCPQFWHIHLYQTILKHLQHFGLDNLPVSAMIYIIYVDFINLNKKYFKFCQRMKELDTALLYWQLCRMYT